MTRKELFAVFAAVAGASLWGIVWFPLQILSALNVKGLWVTFLVFLLISAAVFPFFLKSCKAGNIGISLLPAFIIMTFGGLTNLFFFLALTKTTVVRALMLFYLSPVWNLMAGRITKGHELSFIKICVVVTALSGAAVLLGIHGPANLTWNQGDTFGLLSGIAFAVSITGIQLSPETPSWIITELNWIGAAITSLAGILLLGAVPPSVNNIREWLPVLLIFAFGMQATASFLILFSLTRLESYRVNVLMLFEIVVGTVSYAIWSFEKIHLHEWLGIGMICIASLLDNFSHLLRPAVKSP